MAKTERGITYTTAYQYDKGNNVTQQRYPTGRIVTINRDGLRRVQGINTTVNGQPQTVLSNLQYRVDQQLTQATYGNGLIDNRSYDLQGRITRQSLSAVDSRTYQYDQNGNLLNRTTTPQTSQYQYDALDRLIGDQIDSNPNQSYTYDLNHNRLEKLLGAANDTTNIDSVYGYNSDTNQLAYREQPLADNTGTQATNETRTYNNANRWYQLFKNGELTAT